MPGFFARSGTRTRTGLLPRDFKSLVSTIPPSKRREDSIRFWEKDTSPRGGLDVSLPRLHPLGRPWESLFLHHLMRKPLQRRALSAYSGLEFL